MDHSEMVALIRPAVAAPGGVWADLGAGTGNFTWALAELLGPGATIHAIDRDGKAIGAQRARIQAQPPGATLLPRQADATRPLGLQQLDGVLIANLLHFLRDQEGFLRHLHAMLRPSGQLIVVEYEQALPIPWVPFPVPYARLRPLVRAAGFGEPAQVGVRRSPTSGSTLYAASAARA
jgi:ubiquinone/menaquinone biosynthesis C-methylase UbiE